MWFQPQVGLDNYWMVLDTQPPDGEPGQVTKFGTFDSKAHAVMVAMSLNGTELR